MRFPYRTVVLDSAGQRFCFWGLEMFAKIKVGKNHTAIVDEKLLSRLSKFRWGFDGRYALSRKVGFMHRYILKPPAKMFVDHINGNGIDNRLENLRPCTHAQNMANRRSSNRGSKFLGVFQRPDSGSWVANITKDRKCIKLGTFESEKAAALAYDFTARKLHKEFANLNFPNIECTESQINEMRNKASKAINPLTRSQKSLCTQLRLQGLTARQIAKAAGFDKSKVENFIYGKNFKQQAGMLG